MHKRSLRLVVCGVFLPAPDHNDVSCADSVDAPVDVMPDLAMKPIPEGGTEGHVPNMEKMLPEYYALREWDGATGKPSKKRLNDLGMPEIAASINAK